MTDDDFEPLEDDDAEDLDDLDAEDLDEDALDEAALEGELEEEALEDEVSEEFPEDGEDVASIDDLEDADTDDEPGEGLLIGDLDDEPALALEDDDDELDGLREGEFVCRSCYMAKRESALADPKKMLCRDCA